MKIILINSRYRPRFYPSYLRLSFWVLRAVKIDNYVMSAPVIEVNDEIDIYQNIALSFTIVNSLQNRIITSYKAVYIVDDLEIIMSAVVIKFICQYYCFETE